MSAWRSRPSVTSLVVLGFGLLSLAALADVLLVAGDHVVSSREADTFFYFLRVRRFAVAQILQGNLPLWNPHIFAGVPFLGGWQSALFYPPNVLYLLLPLGWAVNLDVALHVFLFGVFSFAWIRGRGVSVPAAFYGGVSMMFCGAVSVRILAGQLTVLAAACWTPLVLLAAERLLARPTPGWTLLGIAAVTLQILAGYPFYVFASGLWVALTVALRLRTCEQRTRSLGALAALAGVPLLLGAVQLWPALATSAESLRGEGVPYWFASSFSLPLENLATTVVPALFGDTPNTFYWGKWKYWDVCAFLGLVSMVLAVHGALLRGASRQRRFAALFAALGLLLALGKWTPVFPVLFEWVPGFDRFRAPSKYLLHVSLFVSLLAAIGLDGWLRRPNGARLAAAATGVLAGIFALGAFWIQGQSFGDEGSGWSRVVAAVVGPDTLVDLGLGSVEELLTPDFLAETGSNAASSLWIAAATSAAAALLLALRPRWPAATWLLALLGIGEVFAFAQAHHDRFALREIERPDLERFYEEHPGDYRVLDAEGRNHVMDVGRLAVWGYDPVQLDRYGRFMASIKSGRVLHPDYQLPIMVDQDRYHPVLRLVRCRYLVEGWSLTQPPAEFEETLPRLLLVGRHWRVRRHQALRGVFLPVFQPERVVLLEEEPVPAPAPEGAEGEVRLLEESTDHLTVEVDLPAPAILLVTDAYSTGWRAIDESADPPAELRVLPADYVLRAVALPAGRRRVRLEYAPAAYRLGAPVSLASLGITLGGAALWLCRGRSRRLGPAGPAPDPPRIRPATTSGTVRKSSAR
jgi:hypothetical protein